MISRREIVEVITHLFTTIAGLLLLPITAPLVMWTNMRGYADKCANFPGIQTGGGAVSGIAAFVYVIIGVSLVVGAAVAASGGLVFNEIGANGTTGDSISKTTEPTPTPTPTNLPSTETDAGTTTDTETATPTPAQTAMDTLIATDATTPTATSTLTPTQTATDNSANNFTDLTEAELINRDFRYRSFTDEYINISDQDDNITLANYTVDATNETVNLYYVMDDPENGTRSSTEAFALMAHYAGLAESVPKHENLSTRWVPKRVNFTALTPEGEVYRTSKVEYITQWRYNQGVITGNEYFLSFYLHAEPGPAHPDYEANETSANETSE